jgi:hypothetical protein
MQLFTRVIEALNSAGVQYVVVGGIATVLHGYVRLTGDVDLVLSLDPANVRNAVSALASIGYQPMVPVNANDLGDPAIRRVWIDEKGLIVLAFFDNRMPLVRVDVFAEPPIAFELLLRDSTVRDLAGVPVRICSIDHLIEMKELAARGKDLDDIEHLKEIREKQG